MRLGTLSRSNDVNSGHPSRAAELLQHSSRFMTPALAGSLSVHCMHHGAPYRPAILISAARRVRNSGSGPGPLGLVRCAGPDGHRLVDVGSNS